MNRVLNQIIATGFPNSIGLVVISMQIGELLASEMWRREAEDKFCSNSKMHNNVQSQIGCQSLCLEATECVGISYTSEYPSYCYLCHNDELTDTFEFAFYRRGKLCTNQ